MKIYPSIAINWNFLGYVPDYESFIHGSGFFCFFLPSQNYKISH